MIEVQVLGMGKCYFKNKWLDDERYKAWLAKADVPTKFKCLLCKKSLVKGTMGTSALKSHSEQEKHRANVKSKSQLAVLFKKQYSKTPATYGLIAIVTCNNLGVFLQYT